MIFQSSINDRRYRNRGNLSARYINTLRTKYNSQLDSTHDVAECAYISADENKFYPVNAGFYSE